MESSEHNFPEGSPSNDNLVKNEDHSLVELIVYRDGTNCIISAADLYSMSVDEYIMDACLASGYSELQARSVVDSYHTSKSVPAWLKSEAECLESK